MEARESIQKLLTDLEGPDAENVLCTLQGLPGALAVVVEEFYNASDVRRREALVHCLGQFRDPAALPALADALADPADRVWKEALDAIVTLGGTGGREVLERARAKESARSAKREWIDEAIGQLE